MTVIFKKIALGLALGTATILTGCVTVSENTHAYLGSPQFAPTREDSIRIYASEPSQPKERLGEIILSIDGNASRGKVEHKLREAGARLGATGVFIVSDKTHVHPYVYWDWWGPASSEDWHRVIVAVAFRNR